MMFAYCVGRSPRGSGAHTVVARPPLAPASGTRRGRLAAPRRRPARCEPRPRAPTRFSSRSLKVPLALPLGRGDVHWECQWGGATLPVAARDAPSGTSEAPSGRCASTEWDPRVGPCRDRLAPVAADSTLKWRPLRWRPTSRAGAAGREPDERTDLQCKHIKAAHTPPTRPERGRTRRNEPSEVAGRRARTSDRGEVPPARCCVQLTCLPRGRPALVPAACCLLSPLPSSQALVSPELTMRRGRLRPRQKVRPGPLPHRTLHRCSNRACGRDAVAVGAAVPHVQRGRSRPEASLLPLAHRRRRSVRCGAHLLMQQGRCGPPCGSRTRRYPPIASTAGERSQVNSGELGSSGRGILTQSDTHKALMACEARICEIACTEVCLEATGAAVAM